MDQNYLLSIYSVKNAYSWVYVWCCKYPEKSCCQRCANKWLWAPKHTGLFIKSPRVTGDFVFGPFPPPSPPPPFSQHFLGKPVKLISSNHTWLTYRCGKNFWHPSRWPWVKVTKILKREVIYFVPMIKWEPLIRSLQNFIVISPSSYLDKFCLECFFNDFFCKILNPISPVKHSICHILGMAGQVDVK